MANKQKGKTSRSNIKKSVLFRDKPFRYKRARKAGKRGRRKKIQLFFPLTASLIIILSGLILYTFWIFPYILNKNIKADLITAYQPIVYNNTTDIFLIKLPDSPPPELQTKVVQMVKQKYGLFIRFEKINATEDRGINELFFYKNNRHYSMLTPMYIYWDRQIIDFTPPFEVLKQEKSGNNFAKIEEKRRSEKHEVLVKPKIEKFRYNHTRLNESTLVNKARIAIIIDDVGYSYNSTYDFLTLGFPVTFACIPDQTDTDKFYRLFRHYGYDLLLHLPMEPVKGKQAVESNALFTDMPDNEIRNRIHTWFDKYPDAVGANNHMGSKAVTDARLMNVLLTEMSGQHKVWIDSMTTTDSLTNELVTIHQLPYYRRDVFLDNEKDDSSIRQAFERLIRIAKEKGSAIGIGHIQSGALVPVLKDYYERRESLGIEFVPIKLLKN